MSDCALPSLTPPINVHAMVKARRNFWRSQLEIVYNSLKRQG